MPAVETSNFDFVCYFLVQQPVSKKKTLARKMRYFAKQIPPIVQLSHCWLQLFTAAAMPDHSRYPDFQLPTIYRYSGFPFLWMYGNVVLAITWHWYWAHISLVFPVAHHWSFVSQQHIYKIYWMCSTVWNKMKDLVSTPAWPYVAYQLVNSVLFISVLTLPVWTIWDVLYGLYKGFCASSKQLTNQLPSQARRNAEKEPKDVQWKIKTKHKTGFLRTYIQT